MEKDGEMLKRYGDRVGYSGVELEEFKSGGYRVRQVKHLSQVAKIFTIEAEVVNARHCKKKGRGSKKEEGQVSTINKASKMQWSV